MIDSISKSAIKFISGIILFELIIGGGGRLFELGTLTLRMYLFMAATTMSIVLIIVKKKLPLYLIIFIFLSFFSLFLSAFIGKINGASLNMIFIDIKPLLFVLFILSIYFFIYEPDNIWFVSKIIMYTSFLMAIAYLMILSMLMLEKLDFQYFYSLVSPYEEFFFRGNNGYFTYKGFIYIGIGLIFWFYSYNYTFLKIIIIVISVTALVLSGTRGFLLALTIIFFFSVVLPETLKGKLIYVLALTVLIIVSIWFLTSTDLGDKDHSDSIRITQINQVIENTNVSSFIFGHGFGVGVQIRPVHMEIAYAEIYHKQGLLGILLWAGLFIYLSSLYFSLRGLKKIGKPYFLSSVFVFLMSFTNPYMNNPIGLTMIMITLVVLNKIKKLEKA